MTKRRGIFPERRLDDRRYPHPDQRFYSSPFDQVKEQRLAIETIKETQEGQLINNPDYGLLANVAPSRSCIR